MKILMIGGGGREHALAWKLAHDSRKPELFCAPGNAGTAEIATNLDIGAEDMDALLAWAIVHRPDLTVVGPEAPLCAGIADRFLAEALPVFGPTRDAARMEGSKLFAKDIMQAGGVPTAAAQSFTDADRARAYIAEQGYPIVIKADGLAAGKGVYICTSREESNQAVQDILIDREFGASGNELLVEACLQGEEASILALIDGEHIVMLASSQDHKRAFNGDAGPNTGGMGAYSPAPVMTEALWPVVREQVFQRTLDALKKRGITYKGVLYAGLMITDDGPQVLEFNCRFGDPEIQAILPRIDGDLIPALLACIDGTLTDDQVRWKSDACACVVMASGGYPGSYEKGKVIKGLAASAIPEDVVVFHAGTALQDGETVTSGGRVLGVTALGDTLEVAIKRAYLAITGIEFDQAQYRTDIGKKALNR